MNQIIANQHVELACLGRDVKPSPLGLVVANILAVVFRGLHHVDPHQLTKVDWANDEIIALNFDRVQFATCDFDELTQFVVLAHDACVRLSISSPAMKTLRLTFHPRRKVGTYSQSCPSLDDHTAVIRKSYSVGAEVGREESGVAA